MKALEEISNLTQKLDSGDLPPDEPIFYLRAQDKFAAEVVRHWARHAGANGASSVKVNEAFDLADQMDAWPTKQIPGHPETRTAKGTSDVR